LKPDHSEVEIGWTFLAREFWGGRYNGELKSLMLEHAFKFVERVVFVIGENNIRSRRAVERIGGQFLRTADGYTRDGEPRKNVVYSIDRHAYRQGDVEAASD
jgi:RimJ/RimL family protein N-acetyltransferase